MLVTLPERPGRRVDRIRDGWLGGALDGRGLQLAAGSVGAGGPARPARARRHPGRPGGFGGTAPGSARRPGGRLADHPGGRAALYGGGGPAGGPAAGQPDRLAAADPAAAHRGPGRRLRHAGLPAAPRDAAAGLGGAAVPGRAPGHSADGDPALAVPRRPAARGALAPGVGGRGDRRAAGRDRDDRRARAGRRGRPRRAHRRRRQPVPGEPGLDHRRERDVHRGAGEHARLAGAAGTPLPAGRSRTAPAAQVAVQRRRRLRRLRSWPPRSSRTPPARPSGPTGRWPTTRSSWAVRCCWSASASRC